MGKNTTQSGHLKTPLAAPVPPGRTAPRPGGSTGPGCAPCRVLSTAL